MELQQLRSFCAVAKYKSFTTAARKTFRTQPTISLQIKSLEEELGVRLFERLGRGRTELTSDGEALFKLAVPALREVEELRTRFEEERGVFANRKLSIATHQSVMVYLLPSVIKEFKELFPDCQLSVLNRSSRTEIAQMVSDGEADFGITSLTVVPEDLHYQVISRYNRILIAPKDHPLSKKKSFTPRDIAQYPLILPTSGSNSRQIIERVFDENNLECNISMEVIGRQPIKTYVGLDFGISIINEYYLDEAERKKFFVRDVSKFFGQADTGILTRRGKELSVPAQELVKLIVAH